MAWQIQELRRLLPRLPGETQQAAALLELILCQLPQDFGGKAQGLQFLEVLRAGQAPRGLEVWLDQCPAPKYYNLPGAPPPPPRP